MKKKHVKFASQTDNDVVVFGGLFDHLIEKPRVSETLDWSGSEFEYKAEYEADKHCEFWCWPSELKGII